MQERIDIVDTGGMPSNGGLAPADGEPQRSPQPALSVFYRCANAYQKVFRSVQGDRYDGRCPKCGRSVRFVVGAGGVSQRTFEVDCRRG